MPALFWMKTVTFVNLEELKCWAFRFARFGWKKTKIFVKFWRM